MTIRLLGDPRRKVVLEVTGIVDSNFDLFVDLRYSAKFYESKYDAQKVCACIFLLVSFNLPLSFTLITTISLVDCFQPRGCLTSPFLVEMFYLT